MLKIVMLLAGGSLLGVGAVLGFFAPGIVEAACDSACNCADCACATAGCCGTDSCCCDGGCCDGGCCTTPCCS